jgi:lysophospholipase L1-like esterase
VKPSQVSDLQVSVVASETCDQPKLTRFVILYLPPLTVPAFILIDVFMAWRHDQVALWPWSVDTWIAALSALCLVSALVALVVSRGRQGFVRWAHGPLITIYVVYATLFAAEMIARISFPLPPIHGQLRPGHTRFGPIDPAVFPGVHGTKNFTINKLGLRGPLPPKDTAHYQILAIGGSTTICTYLDDSEVWTQLLMETTNASRSNLPIWVGNAGVSGRTTVSHLVLLQSILGVVDADMVFFLLGVNDMYANLAFQGAPTQAILERSDGYQGDLPAGTRFRSVRPLYRRLQIFQLLQGVAGILQQRFGDLSRSSQAGELPAPSLPSDLDVVPYRAQRAKGPIVPIPDLQVGLQEYQHRILALADLCKSLGIRCLFLTQPFLWRDDLSPAEQQLLWNGRVGRWQHPEGFASAADLARAMDAYNRALLDVCRANGLECYDLAAHIPKDTTAFYDDVHFNENGARIVAGNLKQYLLATEALSRSTKQEASSAKR